MVYGGTPGPLEEYNRMETMLGSRGVRRDRSRGGCGLNWMQTCIAERRDLLLSLEIGIRAANLRGRRDLGGGCGERFAQIRSISYA